MVFPRIWPYAAKAIVQHAFDTDHLDIWVIFKFPMQQAAKPALSLWTCLVNDVDEDVTDSDWIDEFTLLLTVDGIAAHPEEVTLEFTGPTFNLRTTWDKQWEPWGAILSTDSFPLPIGSFKGNEIAWVQVLAQGTTYVISDANITVGQVRKTTFQNNQELKIQVAGLYFFSWYMSIEISAPNKHALAGVGVNGAMQADGQNHLEFNQANVEGPMSGCGILVLAVDDLVSVTILTGDAGNPSATVNHIGLAIIKIPNTV